MPRRLPHYGNLLLSCLVSVVGITACAGNDHASVDTSTLSDADSVGVAARPSALPTLPRFADAGVRDSGPPLTMVRQTGGVLLTVDARPGDQINALLPPYVTTENGRRLDFRGPAVTADSAYFVGAVTARVADSLLPLTGTLHTSYCRAGENLCRSATRPVRISHP